MKLALALATTAMTFNGHPLAADTIENLARSCAPNVDVTTIRAIVNVESKGNPLAINVNGDAKLQRQPTNEQEAIATAKWLRENGYNFDAGLAQINSANFDSIGLTTTNVFNACINLAASEAILTRDYKIAEGANAGPHPILVTLSRYNTGTNTGGFRNGYVEKVQLAAAAIQEQQITAIGIGPIPLTTKSGKPTAVKLDATASPKHRTKPAASESDIFGQPEHTDVFTSSKAGQPSAADSAAPQAAQP